MKTELLLIMLVFANLNSFLKDVVIILNYADTTDLTQTDPKLGLPREGLIQCSPVSITNSFIRLHVPEQRAFFMGIIELKM